MSDLKRHFDIGIVVPLDEELEEIFRVFPPKENLMKGDDTIVFYEVESDQANLSIVVVKMPGFGQLQAANTTAKLLSRYSIGMICVLGIAGGLSSDLRVGDVCYSHTVYDLSERSKIEDQGKHKAEYRMRYNPSAFQTPNRVAQQLSLFRTLPEYARIREEWKSECEQRVLLAAEESGLLDLLSEVDPPKSRGGTIISAMVSKSKEYNDEILEIDRKALAIETEAGGVFSASIDSGVPVLVIRGISDLADGEKNELEDRTDGHLRHIAAFHAASFLKYQFSNVYFLDSIRSFRQKELGGTVLSLKTGDRNEDKIQSLLADVSKEIDQELSALSPEYRAKPKGYVLPAPRLASREFDAEYDAKERRRRLSPIEALDEGRVLSIKVPSSYPDESMPWAIADSLMRSDLSRSKLVPIVINGRSISPPTNDVFRTGGVNFLRQEAEDLNLTPVFIVYDFPFESLTKTRFMVEQAKRFTLAKFVFCERENFSKTQQEEALIELPVSKYEICDPSFVSIASFIQKNFGKEIEEAEVVAFKLVRVFQDFDVLAHPTYFAGITAEVITNLVQANRRAELIQLAVDGFLTFLVAGDRASIQISRSTRKRFLTEVVCDLYIEKCSHTKDSLYAKAEKFAKKFDFDISPREFVDEFFDRYLLQLRGNSIAFNLPFMRDYLLAEYLSTRDSEATRYFCLHDQQFDILAFELFSEMSESGSVAAEIIEELKNEHNTLITEHPHESRFLEQDVPVRMLGGKKNLDIARKSVNKFLDEAEKGGGKGVDKEKILDIARDLTSLARGRREQEFGKIQASHGNQTDPKVTLNEQKSQSGMSEDRLRGLKRLWNIGLIALSAGAERLPAEEKRSLSNALISLGTALASIEIANRSKLELDAIKTKFFDAPQFEEICDTLSSDSERDEFRVFIDQFFDFIWPSIVADPLLKTLALLSDKASHKVLGKSISMSEIEGKITTFVQGAWLIDIDSEEGSVVLGEVLKKKGVSPFLREVLAVHLMHRIYWSKWSKPDRSRMIQAVRKAIPKLTIDEKKVDRMADKRAY